jgi:hypothetical protein
MADGDGYRIFGFMPVLPICPSAWLWLENRESSEPCGEPMPASEPASDLTCCWPGPAWRR